MHLAKVRLHDGNHLRSMYILMYKVHKPEACSGARSMPFLKFAFRGSIYFV